MSRRIIIEHDGKTFEGFVAKIDQTFLGVGDRGIFTSYLRLSWESNGVSFGGSTMDTPLHDDEGNFVKRVGHAFGMDLIKEILDTVQVASWEEIVGKQVIALFEHEGDASSHWGQMIGGIAQLDGDKVLITSEVVAATLAREEAHDLKVADKAINDLPHIKSEGESDGTPS